MDFWDDSFRQPVAAAEESTADSAAASAQSFLKFLSMTLAAGKRGDTGLHPVLINASPTFSDSSMHGTSFDVRKTKASAFPHGLNDNLLKGKDYVAVKQTRVGPGGAANADLLDEIALEVRILSDPQVRSHENTTDFIAVVYYNAGNDDTPLVLPALVLEYAEFGNLGDYQDSGHGRTMQDKYDICLDIAEGLGFLHDCGVIHCDVKAANMLVCKHEKRGFVVKVSDFGFAIFEKDEKPDLKGFASFCEAPESHRPLDKKYLRQLDIYSYGLLVHKILKNGANYYDAHPESKDSEYIRRMKESNLLPDVLELNFLLTLRDCKCLMLIFCKILRFCLRAEPSERFQSFEHIIEHLVWADPRDLEVEPKNRDGVPDNFYNEISVPLEHYAQTETFIMNGFGAILESYCAQVSGSPLLEGLKDAYRQRFEREVELIKSRPGPQDEVTYMTCPALDIALFRYIHGLSILRPPNGTRTKFGSGGAPSTTRELVKITGMSDVELHLPPHRTVLKKMHPTVEVYILQQLEVSAKEAKTRPDALYNLAFFHMEGIVVPTNIEKSLFLLEESAVLGHKKARNFLARYFSTSSDLVRHKRDHLLEWTARRDMPQIYRALQVHEPAWYGTILRNRRLEVLVALGEAGTSSVSRAQLVGGAASTSTAELAQRIMSTVPQSDLLHAAAALNSAALVNMIMSLFPALLDATNRHGQTPLIVSCQCGSKDAALALLKAGANTDVQDRDGVTALHWLIAFLDDDKEAIANEFHRDGSKTDPISTAVDVNDFNAFRPNLQGSSGLAGTPLTWAVEIDDDGAADALLKIGANPFARATILGLSPFEVACISGASKCIARFSAESSWKEEASRYRPLGGSVNVNAMFWLLQDNGRWMYVSAHGRDWVHNLENCIGILKDGGAAIDGVMTCGPLKMTAPFAVAYHHCVVEVLQAGLKHGFEAHLDSTFGGATSGGPAMSLAIAHKDINMLRCLIDAGASLTWRNVYKQTALSLAAKELDDPRFAEAILETGSATVDATDGPLTAFGTAVYCGNLRVAKLLWDKGADRDSFNSENGTTMLGEMIMLRTQNAAKRIEFLLKLPDRNDSDGFCVLQKDGHRSSALHVASVPYYASEPFREDPDVEESSRLAFSLLLENFKEPKYINSTMGPHHMTPLAMAAETGNQTAVRLLLEAGADANIKDEYERSPTDLVLWRYCYPGTIEVIKEVEWTNRTELQKRLRFVNQNTSEILSLLKSYGGEASVFQFPGWYREFPGYRDVDWVIARKKEAADKPAQKFDTPYWGGLPIRTAPKRDSGAPLVGDVRVPPPDASTKSAASDPQAAQAKESE